MRVIGYCLVGVGLTMYYLVRVSPHGGEDKSLCGMHKYVRDNRQENK